MIPKIPVPTTKKGKFLSSQNKETKIIIIVSKQDMLRSLNFFCICLKEKQHHC